MTKKFLFLTLIFVLCFVLTGCKSKSPISNSLVGQISAPSKEKLIDAVLVLKYNNEEDKYELKIEQGKSVFDLLALASEQNNFSLEYQNYNIGAFIKAIKGIKNGEDGKYWQYTVNGAYADKAADKWGLNQGDIVEWNFAKSKF